MGHEILQSLLLLRGEAKHQKRQNATKSEARRIGLISLIWKRKCAKKRQLPVDPKPPPPVELPKLEFPMENAPKMPSISINNRRSLSSRTNSFFNLPSFHPISSTMPNASIAELVATERDYIAQLEICHRIFLKEFRRQKWMMECTEAELFGNLPSIRRFHRSVLLPRLLLAQSNAFCTVHLFLQLAPFIQRIYLVFLESRAKFGRLIQKKSIQKWANGISTRHRLGPAQSLDSLLIRPIQRLFQLIALLARIECPKEELLANAVRNRVLQKMHQIPRMANDLLHLQRLFPFQSANFPPKSFIPVPNSLFPIRLVSFAQLGDLLFSNLFRLKANKKASKLLAGKERKGRRKVRHCRVFLFGRGLLLAKQKKERLKPIGCIPLCRLIRFQWQGGPEFCLFLRCSFSQSPRRRRLGKIRFRAENEAIASEWIRQLGAQLDMNWLSQRQ